LRVKALPALKMFHKTQKKSSLRWTGRDRTHQSGVSIFCAIYKNNIQLRKIL
jgi:hypothetical protein